jgi:hypothetical protein
MDVLQGTESAIRYLLDVFFLKIYRAFDNPLQVGLRVLHDDIDLIEVFRRTWG